MSEIEKIHDAISEVIQEDELEDTVLVGWVLVYEGAHKEGKRSLTLLSSDALGEEGLSPWQVLGYIHHVIDSGMAFSEEDTELDE